MPPSRAWGSPRSYLQNFWPIRLPLWQSRSDIRPGDGHRHLYRWSGNMACPSIRPLLLCCHRSSWLALWVWHKEMRVMTSLAPTSHRLLFVSPNLSLPLHHVYVYAAFWNGDVPTLSAYRSFSPGCQLLITVFPWGLQPLHPTSSLVVWLLPSKPLASGPG